MQKGRLGNSLNPAVDGRNGENLRVNQGYLNLNPQLGKTVRGEVKANQMPASKGDKVGAGLNVSRSGKAF